ncbi:hypothetical protein [Staphylococcus felis]|uniref:hypothetical protein n=1 Tax=Staphylococcus felis TaxID=46127 RepID=UPI003967AF54
MSVIIPILLLIMSAIMAIYVLSSKNIKVIASIESERVPKKLINKIATYFSISLMISTLFIAIGIYLTEKNLLVALLFFAFGIVALLPFYYYYHKVQK